MELARTRRHDRAGLQGARNPASGSPRWTCPGGWAGWRMLSAPTGLGIFSYYGIGGAGQSFPAVAGPTWC